VRSAALERLSPKQRQYAMLGAILLGGVGLLWLIFAFTDNGAKDKIAKSPAGAPGTVTNIGVMPPGQQVNPVDQWVGTAGSKLAQYESEREEQGRLNKDRQAFEARTMQRFRGPGAAPDLRGAGRAVTGRPRRHCASASLPAACGQPAVATATHASLPPVGAVSLRPDAAGTAQHADGAPSMPMPAAPVLSRVTLVDRSVPPSAAPNGSQAAASSSTVPHGLHLPARQLHPRHAARRSGCADRRAVAVEPAPGADPTVRQLGAAQPLPRRVPRLLRDRRRLRRHQFRACLPAHREPVLRALRWRQHWK
jgi:conjugal transfer pilus assembly protein TraB